MNSAQICLYHHHSLHRQSSTSKQWLHKDPIGIGTRFSEARGSPLFSIFILFLALFPSSAIYIHNCLPPKPLSASKASSFCLWCMEHGNRRMTSHSWLGQTDSWAYFNTQTHTHLQTHTHTRTQCLNLILFFYYARNFKTLFKCLLKTNVCMCLNKSLNIFSLLLFIHL